MKRLFIALALLLLLVGGSIWSCRTVEATASAIAAEVRADRLDAAYQKWTDAGTLLGALLLHDALDDVDRLFSRALQAQADGQTDALSLDRAELLNQLSHLPELEQPSLRNLF